MNEDEKLVWTYSKEILLSEYASSESGLSEDEARKRLASDGLNIIESRRQNTVLRSILHQLADPLVLILLFASFVSVLAGAWTDSAIIIFIVIGSTLLSFTQEYQASKAIEKLKSQITIRSEVLRNGKPIEILSEQVVRGDVVLLSAGSLIPADGILIESNDFFVNQAILTGETFPAEKKYIPCQCGL